jgi:PD-(D/E)XK nuclease superfamily protein
MEHPVDVGDRTTLAVIAVLREMGYGVLMPLGENTRYDLAIDDGDALAKVQCKTGRLRNGAVRWSLCSNYAHHPNPRIRQRDYHGEVDFFGVFCRENGRVYLVPMADLPLRREGALRIDPPRNRQRKRIRFGAQYEIGRVHVHAPDLVQRVTRLRGVNEVVA